MPNIRIKNVKKNRILPPGKEIVNGRNNKIFFCLNFFNLFLFSIPSARVHKIPHLSLVQMFIPERVLHRLVVVLLQVPQLPVLHHLVLKELGGVAAHGLVQVLGGL